MVVVVVVEEEKSWASCGREGRWEHYIALISIYNNVQHGAGGYCEFLVM